MIKNHKGAINRASTKSIHWTMYGRFMNRPYDLPHYNADLMHLTVAVRLYKAAFYPFAVNLNG